MQATVAKLEAVRAAAQRPLAPSNRHFWLLVAGLGLLVAMGAAAYVYQLFYGLGVAGYSDSAFWGIYEANLVTFIALSYGGALVSAILRLTHARWRASITRLAEAMAVCSLIVGMGFAIIHLGRPERVWRIILTPHLSSPIVWDFLVIMTYLVATVIFFLLPLIPDVAILRDHAPPLPGWRGWLYRTFAFDWRRLPQQRQVLTRGITIVAILIIPLAVLVHSVLSWAFALTGRPGWNSTIFAPYFVVGALYSGVAMVILVVAAFRSGYHLQEFIGTKHFRYLAYLMVTLDLLYLYFTFTELLTEGYTMHEETVPVLESLLVGQYAPEFWLFIVGGGIIPLLLVAIPRTRTIAGINIAAALVVAGMWLKRMLIVVPTVAQPLIGGSWGSFAPTWVALAITVGASASIPLLLLFCFKIFPVLSIDEMEELAAEETEEYVDWARTHKDALSEGGVTQ
jgi:molybdopterin-containing oxidoreductase family membrane subunit